MWSLYTESAVEHPSSAQRRTPLPSVLGLGTVLLPKFRPLFVANEF